MIHPDKAVIIYDGCCLLCINFKNWVEKKALPDLIEFLPCQSEQLKVRYPHISRNACMQALHLVLNNNKTYAGADAFPYIAQRLKFWRHLYYMFKPQFCRLILSKLYDLIAKYRYRLSCHSLSCNFRLNQQTQDYG